MIFTPGQIITRRYVRGDRYTWVQPMRVLADDARGLLLWHPEGSDFAHLVDSDGKTQHQLTLDRMREPRLMVTAWAKYDILVLMPPGAAHSVWWFFRDGGFAGWYVNLETPCTRRSDGVDTTDQLLDIVVTPERRWEWKDTDEFEARIGHPLYLDRATADAVRAEADRLVGLIETGGYPFDGTHTDFRPDPDWPLLRLPADALTGPGQRVGAAGPSSGLSEK